MQDHSLIFGGKLLVTLVIFQRIFFFFLFFFVLFMPFLPGCFKFDKEKNVTRLLFYFVFFRFVSFNLFFKLS